MNMEEKFYQKEGYLFDKKLLAEDNAIEKKQETIDIKIPLHTRGKRISLYIMLTVSVAIFMLAFALADFGISAVKSGSVKFNQILFENLLFSHDSEWRSVPELMVGRVLGVSNSKIYEDVDNYIKPTIKDEPDEIETGNADKGEQTSDPNGDDTAGADGADSRYDSSEKDPEDASSNTKYPIQEMNLSETRLGETYISNETGYTPDVRALLDKSGVVPVFNGLNGTFEKTQPIVLIIHTHGTEAYMEEGVDTYEYDGKEFARSHDTTKNVVAIGAVMTEVLNAEGVKTLHCEIMHDKESYQESYSRAAETIRAYLGKYPSIKYVFDVHRDSILKSDGTLVKPVVRIDGQKAAQVMIVVGSDYKGADFPDWENHLSLALKLRKSLNGNYNDICRPVYLRGAAFNEQYSEGSLLLEIGSSGNTFEEAKRSAKYVAQVLARMIKGE